MQLQFVQTLVRRENGQRQRKLKKTTPGDRQNIAKTLQVVPKGPGHHCLPEIVQIQPGLKNSGVRQDSKDFLQQALWSLLSAWAQTRPAGHPKIEAGSSNCKSKCCWPQGRSQPPHTASQNALMLAAIICPPFAQIKWKSSFTDSAKLPKTQYGFQGS